MTLDDLNLPRPFRQRIEGSLGKTQMLFSVLSYFDREVAELEVTYKEDIQRRRHSKHDQFLIAMRFLKEHGHNSVTSYRESFISHAANYIIFDRDPLIKIGTVINNWARCHTHDLFLKKAHLDGKFDEIISATLPLFKKDKDAIQALSDRLGESFETWKTRVRRFKERAATRDKKKGSNPTD